MLTRFVTTFFWGLLCARWTRASVDSAGSCSLLVSKKIFTVAVYRQTCFAPKLDRSSALRLEATTTLLLRFAPRSMRSCRRTGHRYQVTSLWRFDRC